MGQRWNRTLTGEREAAEVTWGRDGPCVSVSSLKFHVLVFPRGRFQSKGERELEVPQGGDGGAGGGDTEALRPSPSRHQRGSHHGSCPEGNTSKLRG